MKPDQHLTYELDQAEDLSKFFAKNYPFNTWGGTKNFGNYQLTVESDECSPEELSDLAELGIGLDLSGARNYHSYGVECPLPDVSGFFTDNCDRKSFDKYYYWLPIYMYSHSGVTINTTGFSCGWDSGLVGLAFIKKSDFLKGGFFEAKASWTAQIRQAWAEILLRNWVRTLDDYLQNNAYRYVVTNRTTGEEVETCGGFLGDWGCRYAVEDGLALITAHRKAKLLKRVEKLKNLKAVGILN